MKTVLALFLVLPLFSCATVKSLLGEHPVDEVDHATLDMMMDEVDGYTRGELHEKLDEDNDFKYLVRTYAAVRPFLPREGETEPIE